jgi:hypothetical protein
MCFDQIHPATLSNTQPYTLSYHPTLPFQEEKNKNSTWVRCCFQNTALYARVKMGLGEAKH